MSPHENPNDENAQLGGRRRGACSAEGKGQRTEDGGKKLKLDALGDLDPT